jgi:hypothetical protein
MAAQERVDPTGRGCHIVGRQQGGLQFGKRDVGILRDQFQKDRQEGLGRPRPLRGPAGCGSREAPSQPFLPQRAAVAGLTSSIFPAAAA